MRRRTAIWVTLAIIGTILTIAIVFSVRRFRPEWRTIQGVVVRRDTDVSRQFPIAGVVVTGTHEGAVRAVTTSASGYFKIVFPDLIWPGQTINLSFRRADYRPYDLQIPIRFRSNARQLVVAAMASDSQPVEDAVAGPQLVVLNVRVRYTVNSQTEVSVGSAAKIFQVVNRGNVPCQHRLPCSPDGYWKAAAGSVELDAGTGNYFRAVRVSCIAGPCPFTKIDPIAFAQGGRSLTASALDWSDTATFLLEAEVFHAGIVSDVREAYPVVFGRELNFTLPPTEEGVSLEAEINGVEMVFPLGPELNLSWADCTQRNGTGVEKSSAYRCELKPGYRF